MTGLSAETEEPPERLARDIMAAVSAEASRAAKRPKQIWHRWTAAAAVFALILLGIAGRQGLLGSLSSQTAATAESAMQFSAKSDTAVSDSTEEEAGAGMARGGTPAASAETEDSAATEETDTDAGSEAAGGTGGIMSAALPEQTRETVCGILTLRGEPPETLLAYGEGPEYYLPAEEFRAFAEEMEKSELFVSLVWEGDGVSADAQEGMVICTSD